MPHSHISLLPQCPRSCKTLSPALVLFPTPGSQFCGTKPFHLYFSHRTLLSSAFHLPISPARSRYCDLHQYVWADALPLCSGFVPMSLGQTCWLLQHVPFLELLACPADIDVMILARIETCSQRRNLHWNGSEPLCVNTVVIKKEECLLYRRKHKGFDKQYTTRRRPRRDTIGIHKYIREVNSRKKVEWYSRNDIAGIRINWPWINTVCNLVGWW